MLERLSYEACPMNFDNRRFIALAEKIGKYAVDAANEKCFDEVHDYSAGFEYLLKGLCEMNAVDYVVVEIDDNGYPRIKLDNQFGSFESYYYYFVPPFAGWAEETFFGERKKKVYNYSPEFHYPLSCLVTYNKIED